MAIPTIAQTIVRGDISTYLIGNANSTGSLFGGKKASPFSMVSIAMVTDALRWGSDGGAQTDASLRSVANYLIWLCGAYGLEAEAISGGAGGGTVIPGGGSTGSTIYPFMITSGDFEADGVSYNNAGIVGDNLSIFINEYSQQWLQASGTTFAYTATGIEILIPGFDANVDSYTIMIQKLNS